MKKILFFYLGLAEILLVIVGQLFLLPAARETENVALRLLTVVVVVGTFVLSFTILIMGARWAWKKGYWVWFTCFIFFAPITGIIYGLFGPEEPIGARRAEVRRSHPQGSPKDSPEEQEEINGSTLPAGKIQYFTDAKSLPPLVHLVTQAAQSGMLYEREVLSYATRTCARNHSHAPGGQATIGHVAQPIDWPNQGEHSHVGHSPLAFLPGHHVPLRWYR
jgi:hypothetical protein